MDGLPRKVLMHAQRLQLPLQESSDSFYWSNQMLKLTCTQQWTVEMDSIKTISLRQRMTTVFFLLATLPSVNYAITGSLFNLVTTGAETGISMISCLNIKGKSPLSCQKLTANTTSLSLSSALENHNYPYAGIRVLTEGYTPENLGFNCSGYNNGYCALSLNSGQPQTAQVANQIYFSTAANPVIALTMNPVNILNPIQQIGTTPSQQGQDITVASLQTIYDSNFCQLNNSQGVTANTPQCQNDITYINSILNSPGMGFSNLSNTTPFLANPLNITTVNFQKIIFNTTVDLPTGPTTFNNVSGGLFMPNISGSQIKGVVLYFAGSQPDKSDVGSNISVAKTQLIGEIFTSRGYIVVIPDLIGLGDDWANVHPYVIYPTVNIQTAIDMLNFVRPIINGHYTSPALTSPQNLFVTGMSEGGAYALWFSTYLNQQSYSPVLNSFYSLKHSVGLSGAYNISNVTYGYLVNDVTLNPNTYNVQSQVLVNVSKPLLHANTFLSYATYSLNGNYYSTFNSSFYDMDCTGYIDLFGVKIHFPQSKCNINDNQLSLKNAFNEPNHSPAEQILYDALNKTTSGTPTSETTPPNPGILALTKKNSAIPYSSSVEFTNLSINTLLSDTVNAANVNLGGLGTQAVSIVSLNHDSVVSRNNFDLILQDYPSKLLHHILVDETQLKVVSPFSYSSTNFNQSDPKYVPVDHTQFLIYALTIALGIFENIS